MDTSTLPRAAAPTWQSVRVLKISTREITGNCGKVNLFGNTRQQLKITVEIDVLDGSGNSVTDSLVWDSIRLIDLDNAGRPIPNLYNPSGPHPYVGFDSQDTGFEYSAAILNRVEATYGRADCVVEDPVESTREVAKGPGEPALPPPIPLERPGQTEVETPRAGGTLTIPFYISCDGSRQHISLAVEVTHGGGGRIMATTLFEYQAGGWDGHDPSGTGDGQGRFNSRIDMHVLKELDLPATRFGRQYGDGGCLVDVLVSDGWGGSAVETEMYVSLVAPPAEPERLQLKGVTRASDGKTGFSIFKNAGKFDGWEWSMTYVRPPDWYSSDYDKDTLPVMMIEQLIPKEYAKFSEIYAGIVDQYAPARGLNFFYIGQVLGKMHWQFLDSNFHNVPARESERIYIDDVYGNRHKVEIYFANGRFSHVFLRKWT